MLVKNYIVLCCIFILPKCRAVCVAKNIMNNLSIILFLKDASDPKLFFNDTDRNNLNYDCPSVDQMCCSRHASDMARMSVRQLLHRFSGLEYIEDKILDFNEKLKLLIFNIIDTLMYHTYLRLNLSKSVKNLKSFMGQFYEYFHMEMRSKIFDKSHKFDLEQIIVGALKIQNPDDSNDNQMKSYFIDKFDKLIEKNFLLLYRHTTQLLLVFQNIQTIPLPETCINNLLQMSFCGVCSQKLDMSFILSDKKTINIRICNKYCQNIINECMTYYILLSEPLKNFQETFHNFLQHFSFNITEFSQLWFDKNNSSVNTYQMIKNLMQKKQEDSSIKSENVRPKDEEKVYLDQLDIKANDTFLKCLDLNICNYDRNGDDFIKKFSISYNYSLRNLSEIITTLIKPEIFIKNVLANKCKSKKNVPCWNGSTIGKYNKKVMKFSLSENKNNISKRLSPSQNEKITSSRKFIEESMDKIEHFNREKKPNKVEDFILEGSGNESTDISDDEDFNQKHSGIGVFLKSSTESYSISKKITTDLSLVSVQNNTNEIVLSIGNNAYGIQMSQISFVWCVLSLTFMIQ